MDRRHAAITVGRWIRHELFLGHRRRFVRPDENAGEGELEYSPRISVVGDRNRDAVDLLWRKRYQARRARRRRSPPWFDAQPRRAVAAARVLRC